MAPNTNALDSLPDATSAAVASIAWLPSAQLGDILHGMETGAGIPFFLGIALSSVAIRACTIPLLILQQQQGALLAQVRPQLQYLRFLFSQDKQMPFQERLIAYRKAASLIRKKSGYSRLKAWPYMIVQTPMFFCLVLSLRQILSSDPAMTAGGALWFTDLTSKDATLLLPLAAVGLTYYTLESASVRRRKIQDKSGKNPDEKQEQLMSKIVGWYQTALLLSFPLMTQLPMGIFAYWIPSSIWSIGQAKILAMTPVRQWLAYPDLSNNEFPAKSGLRLELRSSAKGH